MFDICIYGNPILRKKASPVRAFDAAFRRFADEMIATMRDSDGVGLAAPQVGASIRLAVVDASGGEKPPYVLVNPRITYFSAEEEVRDEGCLSVPDIRMNVTRPSRVSVEAQDANGAGFAIENADGLLARALQHEIDHLNGILFIDHISVLQRQLLANKLKKMAKSQQRPKAKAA